MDKWNIPGMSVAIAKDGKLFYAKGFGYADTATHEPVTVKSMFRVASCSKPITAIGIFKLYEEGKLNLDDKVFGKDGILNEYTDIKDKRILDITVTHLLQHTIGWPGEDLPGTNEAAYALKKPYPATANDIITYNLTREMDFAPTENFRYSNFGYMVLGEVITKVSGYEYEDYIGKILLQPAGIHATKLGKTFREDKYPDEVIYIDYIPELAFDQSILDTTQIVPNSYGTFNMETLYAAAGWVSRPVDMVKILLAVDGSPSPPDVLKRETLELMKSTPENLKSKYSLGAWVREEDFFYHGGELTWGTSAVMRHSTKDNISFAITVNTFPGENGTMEVMVESMRRYARDLYTFIPETLKNISDYPDIDLFDTY